MSKRTISVPIYSLFPSIITLFALCLGFTAVRYSLDAKWEIAVALIMMAAFLDGVDGRIARLLNSTSNFGAQLDSLVDAINFGVAPGVLLYLWSLRHIPIKGFGWAIVLFYMTCSVIRLARFNCSIEEEDKPDWADKFFTGVPIPAAAVLSLLPVIATFEFSFSVSPWLMALYIMVIGMLMVSRIPTFSLKKLHIRKEYTYFFLAFSGLFILALLAAPWFVLPALSILYLFSIPMSIIYYYKIRKGN